MFAPILPSGVDTPVINVTLGTGAAAPPAAIGAAAAAFAFALAFAVAFAFAAAFATAFAIANFGGILLALSYPTIPYSPLAYMSRISATGVYVCGLACVQFRL